MNINKISTRLAKLSDLAEIQLLFVNTISTICKNDYPADQIKVWTSSVENIQRWTERITSQYFLVAELDNKIVGYVSLKGHDYLDLLYVHKDYQKQGIANKLVDEIEKEAIRKKSAFLHSDVSKTAKSFFEKKGFKVIKTLADKIKEIDIVNYKMSKQL